MIREYFNIIFAIFILVMAFNTAVAFAVKFDYAANTGDNDNHWFSLCVVFGAFAAVFYALTRKKIFSLYNPEYKIIVLKYKRISIGLFLTAGIIFAGILGTSAFFASEYSNYQKSLDNQKVIYNEGNIYNHYYTLINNTAVYYDKLGKTYVDFNAVNHYDKDGNVYVKAFKDDDTYYDAVVNGENISVLWDEAFVDENGCFVQIDWEQDDFLLNKNYENGGYAEYYFADNEDFLYFSAPEVSWDEFGNMYIEGNLLK